jgi:hypothetical protein
MNQTSLVDATYTMQNSSKIEWLARTGYVAKGVVYGTVGVLTLLSLYGAFGDGAVTGSRGAIRAIASQPFGNLLLILMIIGLAGYVVWRFVQGVKDTEGKGSDAAGWMQRIGFIISAGFYASLTFYALTLTGWFSGAGTESGSTKQALTAKLMSTDAGIWVVGLAGLAFIGIGFYQFYRAFASKFKDKWKTQQIAPSHLRVAERFAQLGISARALTLLIIGGLLVQAARRADPNDAQGLGNALQSLRDETYGMIVLTIIGAGLVCYGLYCFMNARYRTMNV